MFKDPETHRGPGPHTTLGRGSGHPWRLARRQNTRLRRTINEWTTRIFSTRNTSCDCERRARRCPGSGENYRVPKAKSLALSAQSTRIPRRLVRVIVLRPSVELFSYDAKTLARRWFTFIDTPYALLHTLHRSYGTFSSAPAV